MKHYSDMSLQPSSAECNGCGVGLLSCPVWMQRHTHALTFCGRNRAAIGGAAEEELAASARACILCGSCEALCPTGIRTQQSTLALRRRLAEKGLMPSVVFPAKRPAAREADRTRLLLAGPALSRHRALLEIVLHLLEQSGRPVTCAAEDGHDPWLMLESGHVPSDEHFHSFMTPLTKASEIIVADGLLFNLLRPHLPPSIALRALGPVLLENSRVRSSLRPGDFLMIETRAYNARREAVQLYDGIRRETGCSMNLDLHRVATPTGASCYQHREGIAAAVSVEDQVHWLLEGRACDRIVVEHLDDRAAFETYTKLRVIHLAEVADNA